MASTGTRNDPFPVYCFKLSLGGPLAGDGSMYFRSVSGLKYETEVVDYQEGGQNLYTHRLVGATKWSNLVLKRGFSTSAALITWREQWLSGTFTRISGEIIQLNTQLQTVGTWKFEKGWPCKWELSEFDASKSELSIETLEIAHHRLEVVKKP